MAVEKNEVSGAETPEVKVELLSAHQAALLLGITAARARHLLRRGLLPGTRLGGTWVIPRTEMEKYIARLCKSARAHHP